MTWLARAAVNVVVVRPPGNSDPAIFKMTEVSMRNFISALLLAAGLAGSSAATHAQTSTQTFADQCFAGRQPQTYEETISVMTCKMQLSYRDCNNLPNEYYTDVCLKSKDHSLRLGQTYLAMTHNSKSQNEKAALLNMYGTASLNEFTQYIATIKRLNNLSRIPPMR